MTLTEALAERAARLRRSSDELILRSSGTQATARAVQQMARSARIASLLVRGSGPRVRSDPKDVLAAMLDAALDATQATRGNLQLLDRRGTLRIHAQRGFAAPFLEFFDEVRAGLHSACGAALSARQQIMVADVRTRPLLRGKPAEVLLDAGVMAVVSSPIIDGSGTLRGMLSTHYAEPGARTVAELRTLAAIARRAGEMLEERAAA